MSEDKTHTKIPIFDGHYDHWSELMENLLKAKGFWGMIERDLVEPIQGTLLTDNQQTMLDEAKMRDHQVMSIANKLRSNREELPDSKIVEKVLRTLSDEFTYIVVSIEESRDIDNMSVDDLQSTLNMHA
ncbi:hypothetical protein LIER_36592 [Lithospermum erythrorhizon]|uniref:Retrovirus-related Pol polyprotein from transposon TNT 1-94 n=1 Tax=Lithospermum erythrorhizon TaxID=34254 RepID=A0AAV3P8B3_LITER